MINWSYKEYVCPEEGCGRIFNTSWILKRHLATHRKRTDATHNCNKCNKKFSRKDSLDRHKQLRHNNVVLMYMCPEDGCDKFFSIKSTLYRHISSHTECYKCEECGSSFSRKDNLTRHKTIHARNPLTNVEEHLSLKSQHTMENDALPCEPDANLPVQDIISTDNIGSLQCNDDRGDHTYALLSGKMLPA